MTDQTRADFQSMTPNKIDQALEEIQQVLDGMGKHGIASYLQGIRAHVAQLAAPGAAQRRCKQCHALFYDDALLQFARAILAAEVPNDWRDAYEGAREDLLDWKRRALDAEAKLRKVGAVLVEGIDVREALQTMADNPEVREKVAAEMMLPGTQL